jgi:hypothetical protein
MFLKKAAPALIMFFVLSGSAHAQTHDCNAYPDIPVNVTPIFEEPKVDLSVDMLGIRRLTNDTAHGIGENIPLGITRYRPFVEFRVPVKTTTFPDGTSCAEIERADVTIGYKEVTIYIANDVPQGTCGFDEIMAHEHKHIAVNRQILQDYVPIIRDSLRDYLRTNGVFYEQDHDFALHLLHEKIQDILNQLGGQMVQDNVTRQRQVDTPQEYRRLSDACNGQLQSVIRRGGM